MRFKTRLLVTSIAIVLVPLLLTSIAFIVVASHVENMENEVGFLDRNNFASAYTIENYSYMTQEVLQEVKSQIEQQPLKLEDKDYLDGVSGELNNKFSYIIVRKEDGIYYTGNDMDAARIFAMLPEYGNEMPDSETGLYYNNMKKLVKQLDFKFADGGDGSFFIVTSVRSLISKNALKEMIFALVLGLCITSIVLTWWMQKGLFTPINQLNTAMQNIAEGNLEYMLTTQEKGEIGELYRNYEDMRLRLKES